MKYIMLITSTFLVGCNTMPLNPEWPPAPNVNSCDTLQDAGQSEKLSELLSVVAANYGKYYECAARVEAWQDWYKTQKRIYENAK